MKKKSTWAVSALVAMSLTASACGSSSAPADTTAAEESTETTAAEATETTPAETTPAETVAPEATETTVAAAAAAGEDVIAELGETMKGKKVTLFTSILDEEAKKLEAAWADFETKTGIDIALESSSQFEEQLRVRAEGGNAADIAIIPQPGLMADLARKGKLIEQPALGEYTKTNHIAGWSDLGTVDGKFYAPPFGANVKSMVWYSPAKFTEKGYDIPKTWPALLELSQKIVDDGGVPWCVGSESGAATGWVMTDWMEDIMLRVNGADVYDQWYKHEIPFNDPKVKAVADEAAKILLSEAFVKGGPKSIATTAFQESGKGVLDGSCFMHRQASFYGNMLPEGSTKGPDGDINIFYFPGLTEADRPVLGGGELLGAFRDAPEVAAVMKFLTSAQYANSRASAGNWLSPNKGLKADVITDPLEKQFLGLLQGATVFRFDASDLMPGAVGAGTFWKEMNNWSNGTSDTDKMLADIEASWPKA
jgi:alpha-glucoside transport system substrate-binding protein